MKKDLLSKVGCKCQKGYDVKIMRSNAGYYVGTSDEDGFPCCRISGYGATTDDPAMNEERDCAENKWCGGVDEYGNSLCLPDVFVIDSLPPEFR